MVDFEDTSIFESRCKGDSQGVIKDLLDQTKRQAVEIHKLGLLTEAVLEEQEAAVLLSMLDIADPTKEQIIKKLKIITGIKKKKK